MFAHWNLLWYVFAIDQSNRLLSYQFCNYDAIVKLVLGEILLFHPNIAVELVKLVGLDIPVAQRHDIFVYLYRHTYHYYR
jgi:hypothetical protein